MRVEIAAFGLAEEEERIILAFLRAPPVAFYLCVNKEYMESSALRWREMPSVSNRWILGM